MSYEFYKVLHIVSILLVFTGLAGTLAANMSSKDLQKKVRMPLSILHGIGATTLLVSGFGLAARLGLMQGLPGWVWVKITIWVILGGSIALAKRKAAWGMPLLYVWILLGGTAAYFAINKPL